MLNDDYLEIYEYHSGIECLLSTGKDLNSISTMRERSEKGAGSGREREREEGEGKGERA